MRPVLIFFLLVVLQSGKAQHCPWDCSGMILLQTTISREQTEKLRPVLVDESKKEITDTMYGTGKDTYDPCAFLYYDDFAKYRTEKIALHHWYQYDTVYHFAAGKYIVKYNFCKYNGKKLYLRFVDPYARGLTYHYIEIFPEKRIHLHNYSSQIFNGETEEIKTAVQPFTLSVSCKEWKLRENECNN